MCLFFAIISIDTIDVKLNFKFYFFNLFITVTEILFFLSDITLSNACIRFKGDGKHAYHRTDKYGCKSNE